MVAAMQRNQPTETSACKAPKSTRASQSIHVTVLTKFLRSHAMTGDTYLTCAGSMRRRYSPRRPGAHMLHAASIAACNGCCCPAYCARVHHVHIGHEAYAQNDPVTHESTEREQAGHATTTTTATALHAPVLESGRSPCLLHTDTCNLRRPKGRTVHAAHSPEASVAAKHKRRSAQWHERAVAQTSVQAPGDRQQS